MHLYPSKIFKLTNEKLFSNRLTFMIFLRQNEIDTAIFSLEVVRHNHDRRETIQVIYCRQTFKTFISTPRDLHRRSDNTNVSYSQIFVI